MNFFDDDEEENSDSNGFSAAGRSGRKNEQQSK